GVDNGSAITGDTVTCTSSDGGVAGTGSGWGSAIVVSGLTTAKTYTCTVRATNVRGTGPASVASAAVVVGSPVAPTNAKAVPGSKIGRAAWREGGFTAGVDEGGARTGEPGGGEVGGGGMCR